MDFRNLLMSGSSEHEHGDEPAPDAVADSNLASHSQRRRARKRNRQTFTDPALILDSLPEILPDAMCRPSELEMPTPSEVLALAPTATSAQIAQFFNALKNIPQSRQEVSTSSMQEQENADTSLASELKRGLAEEDDARHVSLEISG